MKQDYVKYLFFGALALIVEFSGIANGVLPFLFGASLAIYYFKFKNKRYVLNDFFWNVGASVFFYVIAVLVAHTNDISLYEIENHKSFPRILKISFGVSVLFLGSSIAVALILIFNNKKQ